MKTSTQQDKQSSMPEQGFDQKYQRTGAYPSTRMRRLRSSGWIREMVAEHQLSVRDLVWPAFVIEGQNTRESIASMPGVERVSLDILVETVKEAADHGIQAVALFPVVPADKKSAGGAEAVSSGNLMCRSIQTLKQACPDVGIITDVALDPYTTHGHDGLLADGMILNDETVEVLAQQALVQAQAGADVIAPSDMMDGRVGVIREALELNGFSDTLILSYAAKYASHFYGPFRDAVNSSGFLKGDKKTYQMNPANGREALREVALDVQEGADMVMVKPGLPYLDVITRVKETFHIPTFAYHVSGEYAMLRAAADNGWLDYDQCLFEALLSFKRAGCDGVLTYGALDCAKLLKNM